MNKVFAPARSTEGAGKAESRASAKAGSRGSTKSGLTMPGLATDSLARGGIQSVDGALVLLRAMASFRGPVSLSVLARAAHMPTSKAHRYLASFVHAGLIVQEHRSGRYDLGPLAATLGFAALSRSDFVNRTADQLHEITARTGLTALLTIWSETGAVIVRWERAENFIATALGLGTSMPLLNSASGRVFLAFLPQQLTRQRAQYELERAIETGLVWPDMDLSWAGIEAVIERARADGIAAIDGRFIPGLNAISAPVLNWQGHAECAVTLIGTRTDLLKRDGPVADELRLFTGSLSRVQDA